MAGQSSAMIGWSWTDVSVLGSQVFGPALMDSCGRGLNLLAAQQAWIPEWWHLTPDMWHRTHDSFCSFPKFVVGFCWFLFDLVSVLITAQIKIFSVSHCMIFFFPTAQPWGDQTFSFVYIWWEVVECSDFCNSIQTLLIKWSSKCKTWKVHFIPQHSMFNGGFC